MSRIKELENLITYHRNKYYNGTPEINDELYDNFEEELRQLDSNNRILNDIGKTTWDGFPKVKHNMFMHSQEKVSTEEAFSDWWKKRNINSVILEYKLDGLSIALQYKNGILDKAVTRGDGETGDDVTDNVKKMKNVIFNVSDSFTGTVRSEIIMNKSTFNNYFKNDFANPRNLASGICKNKEGKNCEFLNIIAYDVQGNIPFYEEKDKLTWLYYNKFTVVANYEINSIKEIFEKRNEIEAIRKELDYDIDGIVIKDINIDLEDVKRKRPMKQIAFKWESDAAETILREVIWSNNGHNYTPVAIFDAVNLMGTTVKQASLVNIDEIKRLDIMINDKILVSKRGEIIPKIEEKIENAENRIPIIFITKCRLCNSNLIITNKRIYCNNEFCEGKIYHKLQKWTNTLDVKGFGDALILHLIKSGISTIIDLYNKDLINKSLNDTNLKKAFQKAFDNLYSIKEISLSKFIAGFDIEGIGEGIIEFLVNANYNTFDKLMTLTKEDLLKVEGFSEIRAEVFMNEIPKYLPEMINLQEFIYIKSPEVKKEDLKGKSFCFTGALETMKRNDAEKLVKEKSGEIKAVTKGLTYLVTNDTTTGSSKLKKAKDLGIKIITEKEFLKIINE